MPRQARGHHLLGAYLTAAFLCSASFSANLADQSPPTVSDPLSALVEQERAKPVTAIQPPLPKPVMLDGWGVPPADLAKARETEAEIVDRLGSSLPSKPKPESASNTDTAQAERLAEDAERAIEQGNLGQAARLFREALRHDPGSIEIWTKFGRTLDRQANPIGAKSAYGEAIALGARDADTLLRYGLLAAQFREDPAAIAALSMASGTDGLKDDAARFVLARSLADALARSGYTKAAVLRYAELLDLPSAYNAETVYRDRLNEVYRSRREAMLNAAEASHSIGDWQRLDAFLNAAAAIPGPKHTQETAIRCYALLQTQRPAQAASLLLDDLGAGSVAPETIDLLRYIAEHSDIQESLREAINKEVNSLTEVSRASTRQTFVLARAAVAQSDDAGRAILFDHLKIYPTDRAIWLELLRTQPAESVAAILDVHPCLEPDLTEVALRLHGPLPIEGTSALSLRSILRAGDYTAALNAYINSQELPPPNQPEQDVAIDYARLPLGVELLVDNHQGIDVDLLIDSANRQARATSQKLSVARAMLTRGRYRDALAVLELAQTDSKGDSGQVTLVENLTADALLLLGEQNRAIEVARQTLDRNAADYEASILLAELTGESDAQQRLRSIAGTVAYAQILQAETAIEREQFDLAERLLSEAWSNPLRPNTIPMRLVSLWTQTGATDRAEAWLSQQIEVYPDRIELHILLSQLLRQSRRPEDALQVLLDARTIRQGSPLISLELEAMLRDDFEAKDRWLSQARNRLSNAPSTFAAYAERSEIELAAGHIEQAVELAELAADLAPDLSPSEQQLMNTLIGAISREIINRPRVSREAIAGFSRIFQRLDAPNEDAWRGRISVASIDRESDEGTLIQLATEAGTDLPDFRQDAFVHAAQAIMIASHTGQSVLSDDDAKQTAITVYSEATKRLDPYPTMVLGAWIDFTQQTQDPYALGEAIRSLGAHRGGTDRRLREALNYLSFRGNPRIDREGSELQLAENASYLASQLTLNEQFDTATTLYEEVLRLQPEHAETNNSYGYHLLERGEQVDRAVRMIEIAYAQQPNDAHIVDSMGWARYKRSQLDDRVAAATGMVQPGAISLLRRAKSLALQADPTGLTACYTVDHLGDALWASGQQDAAVVEWTESIVLANRASKGIRGMPLPLSIEVELQGLIESAESKIRAASEDRAPEIAPMLD